ncbi:MAG: hypothetical protein LIP28_06050 [Deltaproteobacteria bacterium]|nr:hypothetical protein [Deltaproteobacteria bacterium]
MKAFRFAPRSFAFLCGAFLAAGLSACAGHAGREADLASASARADLGDFTVFAVAAEPETGLLQPALLYKNRDISPAQEPVRDITPGPKVADFPLPGCESMKVEMFTGGANCCFGYYLLASCPDGEHAAYVEPRNGGVGEARTEMKAYAVDDPAFFYYEPKNQSGADKLSLSRVESPRLTRFLVFDNGEWRADKAGEFPAAYKALLADVRRDKTMNRTARAVSMAYYALMAGRKEAEASRILKRALPGQYGSLAPEVFNDVKAAVAGFDPARTLTVAN